MPSSAEMHIIQPGRAVVVEPVLFMSALFGLPLVIMSQLYILNDIKTELRATDEFANISYNGTVDLCHANASDPVVVFNAEAQKRASYFSLICTTLTCIPALFVSLFLGAYSDKVGRKYAILPPLAFGIIRSLAFVLVILLKLPIWYLFIGSLLEGFGGYFTTLLLGCFAYISDTTTPDNRRFRITICETCMFVSAVIGPMAAGILIEKLGFLYTFIITLIGQSITILYTIFLVPETIKKDPEAKFFTTSHFKRIQKVFTLKDASNRSFKLIIVLIAFLISTIPTLNMGIDTLFLSNRPLCMKSAMIGYYNGVYLGGSTICGLFIAWVFKYCFCDQAIALIAGIGATMKYIYMAFAQSILMIFFTPVFGMFSLLFLPTLRAVMSLMVTESEQGSVFGAIACVEVLGSIIGAAIFSPIYASTESYMSGFVYLAMASFLLVGCIILSVFIYKVWRDDYSRNYTTLNDEEDDENRTLPPSGLISASDE